MKQEAAQGSTLDTDELLAQAAAWVHKVPGVPAADPLRLHYIEALARRLQTAAPPVQPVLRAKLAHALEREAGGGFMNTVREGVSEPAAGPASEAAPRRAQAGTALPPATLSLLGQLNRHVRDATASSTPASSSQLQDLRSATRFRETWARISAEKAVDQAVHRAPENAGPLNAHNLVLRTLGLMRELSPDYLRRFLNHTETLLWLDQAYGQLKQPATKAKAARQRK